MGNTTDPMGESIFNICIAFYTIVVYTLWNDLWGTKLTQLGGSMFNTYIASYTHWNNIWVTKVTPWEGRPRT